MPPPPLPRRRGDYRGWLAAKKAQWRRSREERKRKRAEEASGRSGRPRTGDRADVGALFQQAAAAATAAHWQVVSIAPTPEPGAQQRGRAGGGREGAPAWLSARLPHLPPPPSGHRLLLPRVAPALRLVQGMGGDQRPHECGAAAHPPHLLCGRGRRARLRRCAGCSGYRAGAAGAAGAALGYHGGRNGLGGALMQWGIDLMGAWHALAARVLTPRIPPPPPPPPPPAEAEGFGPLVKRTLPGGQQPTHTYQVRARVGRGGAAAALHPACLSLACLPGA